MSSKEVGNRQEVQFLPRRQGVVKKNELLTSAAKWFRRQCDAEDEESDAFRGLLVWCGIGVRKSAYGYKLPRPPVERNPVLSMTRGELDAFEVTSFVEWNGKPVASVKTGFASAVRIAGLDVATGNVTPHTLRHTAATPSFSGE